MSSFSSFRSAGGIIRTVGGFAVIEGGWVATISTDGLSVIGLGVTALALAWLRIAWVELAVGGKCGYDSSKHVVVGLKSIFKTDLVTISCKKIVETEMVSGPFGLVSLIVPGGSGELGPTCISKRVQRVLETAKRDGQPLSA
jgi:hypothetical protein